jgi:hypothetical protein
MQDSKSGSDTFLRNTRANHEAVSQMPSEVFPSALHQGNYTCFNFGVRDFDLGFRYFLHFLVLLLSIARTLAFLNLTLAYV